MFKEPLALPALPAGSTPGPVGTAAETNPAVFPHRRLSVHRTVEGVRLQTPLERRADWTPAGSADGSAGGEFCAHLCSSKTEGFLSLKSCLAGEEQRCQTLSPTAESDPPLHFI